MGREPSALFSDWHVFFIDTVSEKIRNVPKRYEHKNFNFMFDVTLILIS